MGVVIRDGIGRSVYCHQCNKELVISSQDNYSCCVNCGQPYNGNYTKAIFWNKRKLNRI